MAMPVLITIDGRDVLVTGGDAELRQLYQKEFKAHYRKHALLDSRQNFELIAHMTFPDFYTWKMEHNVRPTVFEDQRKLEKRRAAASKVGKKW